MSCCTGCFCRCAAWISLIFYIFCPFYALVAVPVGYTLFLDHNCNIKTIAKVTDIQPYRDYAIDCRVTYIYTDNPPPHPATLYIAHSYMSCLFTATNPTTIPICYGYVKPYKSTTNTNEYTSITTAAAVFCTGAFAAITFIIITSAHFAVYLRDKRAIRDQAPEVRSIDI